MKNSYFSTDRGGRLQYQNLGLLNGKSVAKLKGYGPLYVIIYNPKNNTRTWYWEDKEGEIRSTTEFRRYDNIDFISTINDHKVRRRDNLASTNWLAIDYARYTPDELKNTLVYHPDNLYKIFDKCFECDFILHPEVLLGYYGYVKDNISGLHLNEGLEKGIRKLNVDLDYSIEQMRKRKNVIVYKEDLRHWARSWFLGGAQIFDDNYERFYSIVSTRLNGARKYHHCCRVMMERHNIPYERWSLDTGDYSKTFEVTKEFSRYETEGTGPLLPDNLRYMVDGWINRYMSEFP